MNNFNCEHLVAMGRNIPTPFYLSLGKEQKEEAIRIESLLRLVPGKRLTGISNWRNQSVIVKLFFGPGQWKRNLLSDIRGINLLRQRHILTPEILHHTATFDGKGAVLLMDYLQRGKSLQELVNEADNEDRKLALINLTVATIAKCHGEGLWQNDIHLENFMLVDDRVYVLDGGDINAVDTEIGWRQASENLSLFFAQFPVDMDINIPALLDHYQSEGRNLAGSDLSGFAERVIAQRIKRLNRFEKKLFRSTTAYRSIHELNRFVVYDRLIHSDELGSFIDNPNRLINHENLLKAGNASTVARVAFANRKFVLKRYNLKSFWHGFKYLFKTSRAHRSWLSASILEMLGINTPHPYLIYEERKFWLLRRRAFFLSEDLDEGNLLEKFEKFGADALPIETLVLAFKQLFETMNTYLISHGDMKASNFVYLRDRLYVLDLDAMQRHKSRRSFNKAFQKDLKRFMKNWHGSTFESQFAAMIVNIQLKG